MRTAFANVVQSTDWTPVVEAIQRSEQLLEATWNKDMKAVADNIKEVRMGDGREWPREGIDDKIF